MKSKKWIISLLCCTLAVIIAFGSLMFWLDPLVQFGAESVPLTSYEYSEMYSNPGIAKNYSYDSVMVGTSMIENTDADLCNKLFNCNMVRLPYSGGTTYNMKTILDVCFKSESQIKTIYWELDEFQLTGSSTEPRYPLPEYLYTDKKTDKLSYLLNLDIFYHYAIKDIIGTIKGETQKAERRDSQLLGNFSKENMLSNYSRPDISNDHVDFEKSNMLNKVKGNLDNITTLVEEHKDTNFVFFFVPFSVLYWDNSLRTGQFDAEMDAVVYSMKTLLQYDNVEIYFYHNEKDIITNLDNYKDYSHYCSTINNQITEYIYEKRNHITKDNYELYVNDFRNFIKSYDFETIFS